MLESEVDARFRDMMMHEAAHDERVYESMAWFLDRQIFGATEKEVMAEVAKYYGLKSEDAEEIMSIQDSVEVT